jgi:REP element-mobilizing transposase RayT
MSRPKRLDAVSYIGPAQYFLTFCVRGRRAVFAEDELAKLTLAHFRHAAALHRFAILAYCLMPDHAHLLVEGLGEKSDLRRFAATAKQRSGAGYALRYGGPLWQEGFYDRVLRHSEDARMVARYVLANPVRAGLVESPTAYPYSGSEVWSLEDLIESVL